jgi:hypothetical protein
VESDGSVTGCKVSSCQIATSKGSVLAAEVPIRSKMKNNQKFVFFISSTSMDRLFNAEKSQSIQILPKARKPKQRSTYIKDKIIH